MEKPYADYLIRNYRSRKPKWQNRPENTKACVIVEGTARWQLFPVIANFKDMLGDGWNLYMFHTAYNAPFIDKHVEGWDIPRFTVEDQRITAKVNNSLFKNPEFWNVFNEEWVLSFQCDCIACKPLEDEWFAYDYVGAPCGENTLNGGLALRKRAKMQEALQKYGPYISDEVEDVFFTKALRLMDADLPNEYDAARFSVESFYYELPFGVHGTDKSYHPLTVAERIVSQMEGS